MTDPQPEYVWAYTNEKPGRSRMWLMIGLGVVAVIAAVAVVLAFVRPWEAGEPASSETRSPAPSATASASPSPTPSATPSPSPTSSPSPAPTPSSAPTAPPAPADPALPVFRGKVQPLLDAAATGLSYAQDASGEEGMQIADELRGDAGRMADTVTPSSIAAEWRSRVQAYGESLDALRAAFGEGTPTSTQLSAARSKLRSLNELIAG
ncbi:hypothetical protein V2S04_08550 [Microbacterium sp. OR21]|uniref:hypothetical protein n=1 Tax=Microbacterium sp. OR21 TaxID=3095346 RepID=UPI0039B4DF74